MGHFTLFPGPTYYNVISLLTGLVPVSFSGDVTFPPGIWEAEEYGSHSRVSSAQAIFYLCMITSMNLSHLKQLGPLTEHCVLLGFGLGVSRGMSLTIKQQRHDNRVPIKGTPLVWNASWTGKYWRVAPILFLSCGDKALAPSGLHFNLPLPKGGNLRQKVTLLSLARKLRTGCQCMNSFG